MTSQENFSAICPIHKGPIFACPSDCSGRGNTSKERLISKSEKIIGSGKTERVCSEDGKHSISLEYEGDDVVIMVDGKQKVRTPAYIEKLIGVRKGVYADPSGTESILDIAMSPNGEHSGFIRRTEGRDYMIYIDGRPVFTFKQDWVKSRPEGGIEVDDSKPHWQNFDLMTLTDDGKHWACIGRDINADRSENREKWRPAGLGQDELVDVPGRGWQVLLDGEAITRPVQTLGGGSLALLADGRFRFSGGSNYPNESEGIIFYGTKSDVNEKVIK